MTLLAVECVSRHFGNLRALNDVSMNVQTGELRAVIGPNGAGKTTFFNLISGFFHPTAGRILFDGNDIAASLPIGEWRWVWRALSRSLKYFRSSRSTTTCVFPSKSSLATD